MGFRLFPFTQINYKLTLQELYPFFFLQAVIVPCGLTATLPEAEKNKLLDKCKELEDKLKAAGVRAKGDYRDNYSPGWKFNHWELKVL